MQQPLPHRDAYGNPTNGAPQAHLAELTIAVLQVMEGNGVRQRHRRAVQDRVQQREDEEALIGLDVGELPHQHRAYEVRQCDELLRRKEAVSDLAGDERCQQRTDRSDHEHQANLFGLETTHIGEEWPQDGQPCTPDGVLQEHHAREPGPYAEVSLVHVSTSVGVRL